jgi:TPR repeat protein
MSRRCIIFRAIALLVLMWGGVFRAFAGRDSDGFNIRDITVEPVAKKALVVGIRRYDHFPELHFPDADALAIAAAWRKYGFHVDLHLDLTREEFEEQVDRFAKSIQPGDVVFFYFAGHGTSMVGGENLLVPRDFSAKLSTQVRAQTVALNAILESFRERKPILIAAVLDACRTSLFSQRGLGSVDGLAATTFPSAIIGFPADQNERALELETIKHGIYTQSVLDAMEVPGLTLQEIFRRARFQTRAATDGQQNPYVYDGSNGDFILNAQRSNLALRGTAVAPPVDPDPETRASAGDPRAMITVAGKYCQGPVGHRDALESEYWLRKAAETNTPAALAAYGIALSAGTCIPPDDSLAVQLLSRAALGNESEAMYYLGIHFRDGRGVPADQRTARGWFQRSADLGFPAAKTAMGVISIQDPDVSKMKRGCQYLLEAATLGDPDGMARAGDALRRGAGCPVDAERALMWTKKAAELDNLDAIEEMIYFALGAPDAESDTATAAFWAKRRATVADAAHTPSREICFADACYSDHHALPPIPLAKGEKIPSAAALYALGEYFRDPSHGDLTLAEAWILQAAKAGAIQAKLALGVGYSANGWLSPNPGLAAAWYKSAADDQNPEGLFHFGLLCESGIGVPRDRAAAKRLMNAAAKLGHAQAKAWLGTRR